MLSSCLRTVSRISCHKPSRHSPSWFTSVIEQMLNWLPSFKALLHVSQENLPIHIHQIKLLALKFSTLVSQLYTKPKFCGSFFQATNFHHSNILFKLFLSEERAEKISETCNKIIPFPLPKQNYLSVPPCPTFLILFCSVSGFC